jgi:putative ABC transport system substrate-binding protein
VGVGKLVAWPLMARAQQMPVIGFLSARSPGESASVVRAFREGLGEGGYVEGKNVAIEYRWAEGRYDRLPELAAELIGRRVDVIAATGGDPSPVAAKKATTTIPIVFTSGGDPVATGLVTSLSRPGGNVTGATVMAVELAPKRLELIRQIVPNATTIAMVVNPKFPQAQSEVHDVESGAHSLGLQVNVLAASTESEIDKAFAHIARQKTDAAIIATDPFLLSRREQLARLSLDFRVPTMSHLREFVEAGALMSYGPSILAAYRQAGVYTGNILKGAKPADLPVMQPTKFELAINLKTAKVLGLQIPDKVLALTDEVIE